jgi:radical SAM superfamily enzyme YgiQ (UPF0313 family)
MKVKMILPALTEAKSPFWRPIKYSLFPPLGLATLAAYLEADDEITLQDEHVERLDLNDEPDLVVIQVYITSAYRAYQIADHCKKSAYVCGWTVTSLPEAQDHADTIFSGPGGTVFLRDLRAKHPLAKYVSEIRTLADLPFPRRDLIKRHLYLVPNSLVVSRGCPHVCDFCYKEAFFEGGKSFYTLTVDRALAEIDDLPGNICIFWTIIFGKSSLRGLSLMECGNESFMASPGPSIILKSGLWKRLLQWIAESIRGV